jgi:Protein of unknown function (DUF3750)
MLRRMPRPGAKLLLLLPLLLFALAYLDRQEAGATGDWRAASRAPVGLAPDPDVTPEPVIQVYAARAVRWRGYFGVHTWIAVKPLAAPRFTVYEVSGWRLRRTGSSVNKNDRAPDSRWFGSTPALLAERRGAGVDDMIARVEAAVRAYPYADTYRVWPGPNSNTFTAFVLRAVPELETDLPATAIGKDYLGAALFATAPSGTGWQFSALGVLGVLAGVEEGLELNLLGLTFGIDPLQLSLKLPMVGRIGWPDCEAPSLSCALGP